MGAPIIEEIKGNVLMDLTWYRKILISGDPKCPMPAVSEAIELYKNDPLVSRFVNDLTARFIKILVEN